MYIVNQKRNIDCEHGSILYDGRIKMNELKPCPFCGGEAEYTKVGNSYTGIKEATIKCKSCLVQRKQKFLRKKFDFEWIDKMMIEAWNMRV